MPFGVPGRHFRMRGAPDCCRARPAAGVPARPGVSIRQDRRENHSNQALKLDPANRLALEATGIAAIRRNRPDAAVGIFESMNRAYPDDAHVNVIANLAVAYRSTGRIDDAMQLYRRVKTLDPQLAQRLCDEKPKGVATP
ncbi:tetratricopeptide repeat protein [Burkholderia cepacia]|uniref:tetratricopeptide repeat protein n=1 Tax=Burkholderia cepacia TaxID=292 RepID=UPI002018842A|nr:tetratricopeptide repeat protein [Burkholderia cepacia]UQO38083.1 tetratricopeptide repeat protein [Burkholderia cepacia]UQO52421.1 tetratricopeptide repeat protein [Burkholderia cepacia]UQP06566.1 tetratricopeptide repeat protein [Burkholderia cepacia]